MTVLDAIRGISAYPVPQRTIEKIAGKRGLELETVTNGDVFASKAYNLATADILMWLSAAPDVSQGGQSYSFTDEQRKQFRLRANGLYDKYDPTGDASERKTIYGYKGDRL